MRFMRDEHPIQPAWGPQAAPRRNLFDIEVPDEEVRRQLLSIPTHYASSAVKEFYVASSSPTFTIASLASDTNLLAGRSSVVIDNTANLYLDYGVSAQIYTGTSPTAGQIELWAWAVINDTPTYPDTITGSDANITLTSTAIKGSGLREIGVVNTDTNSNRGYPFALTSVKGLFGGFMPLKFGFWVVHNTVAALKASSHVFSITPDYINVG